MTIPAIDLLSQLRSGKISALDRHLNRAQMDFEAGRIGEDDLIEEFTRFNTYDLTLSEGFQQWHRDYPQSYAAHAAIAQWFLARGWEARGRSVSTLVSDQGWRALHHFLDQTDLYARAASQLTANPLMAWQAVGYAANARGCSLTLEQVQAGDYPEWFLSGVQNNPATLVLRKVMLYHLRTEWGGSEEHMLAFLRQQEEGGQLPQAKMQELWAEFHALASHHAGTFGENPALSVERATLASNLSAIKADQLFIALTGADAPSQERLAALGRYLGAAERRPTHVPAGMMPWALAHAGDWMLPELPRLVALYRRAAEWGSGEAAVGLGYLQLAHPKWPVPDAGPALLAAREQGHTEAAELIVHLSEMTVTKRLRETNERRQDILRAADLASGDMSWRVYLNFAAYRKQFGLDDRAKYRYLLRAADAGNDDARVALAQQLRAGLVETGEDGVLRPVNTRPLQASLDYAKHLLERAAANGHKRAEKLLRKARDRDWEASKAKRLRLNQDEHLQTLGGRPWWWWLVIGYAILVGIRGCAQLLG